MSRHVTAPEVKLSLDIITIKEVGQVHLGLMLLI